MDLPRAKAELCKHVTEITMTPTQGEGKGSILLKVNRIWPGLMKSTLDFRA